MKAGCGERFNLPSSQHKKAAPCTGAAFMEDMELSLIFYHERGRETMTLQELSHHVELRKRLAAGMELLQSLEAAQKQDDPGFREWAAAAIADAKEEIARTEAEIARSESEITEFIGAIGDLQTRTVFRLRFFGGLSWRDVAEAIGGGNTEAGVRMICYRHLEASAGKGVEWQ